MDASDNDLEAIHRILAELTTRVYHIERKLGIDTEPVAQSPTAVSAQPSAPALLKPPPVAGAVPERPAPPAIPSVSVPPQAQAAYRVQLKAEPAASLESRIGSHWLNRIGITAVLIGISYFLKFAFDNNWIGPAGRVAIGLLAGIGVVVWSELFRAKGYKAFSYSLKAVGIGTLYLSLWAAFQIYNLIPSSAAFVMMLAVTSATAAMAWTQDAQLLAAFALAGGFTTPLLLSTGQNREVALFTYVLLLDVATLFLVVFKPWRRLLVMSYAGTLLLYIGWYASFYSRSQLGLTLTFATLFFAIFAIAPLITLQPEGEQSLLASIPAVVAFVNAVVYFLQAYVMIEEVDKTNLAWFALALATVYIVLSRQVHPRTGHSGKSAAGSAQVLHFLHLAVALGFITVAIPIRLDAHWITIGWFVEAGILLWVGERVKSEMLNMFALAALALGVVRLLAIDNFHTTQLIFNVRMATYTVAVGVLGAVAYYASRRADDAARTVAAVAVVALNALALIALSHEIADYFAREMTGLRPVRGRWTPIYGVEWHRVEIERDFTYSALWMAYGAMLMVVGFFRRSAFVRWQALLLVAATIVKVFIYDVSQLDRGYRIVSFIVLGVLLLAISFVYQRDWLQLSAKHKTQTNPEGSSAGI
jgi:uncharacterized membrane protein